MRQRIRARSRALAVSLLVAAAATASLVGSGASVQAAPVAVHFTAAGDFNGTADTTAVLAGVAASQSELTLASATWPTARGPSSSGATW